jgi:hypothetical protein
MKRNAWSKIVLAVAVSGMIPLLASECPAGTNCSTQTPNMFIQRLDTNGDGKVSKEEFLANRKCPKGLRITSAGMEEISSRTVTRTATERYLVRNFRVQTKPSTGSIKMETASSSNPKCLKDLLCDGSDRQRR